jgi:hypothetical protein
VTVFLHLPQTQSPGADSDEARLDALCERHRQTGPHTPKAELDGRIQEERDAGED